jgi:hypothetical protein
MEGDRARTLDQDDLEMLLSFCKGGMSVAGISETLNIGINVIVSTLAQKLDIVPKRMFAVIKLREQGKTLENISKLCSIPLASLLEIYPEEPVEPHASRTSTEVADPSSVTRKPLPKNPNKNQATTTADDHSPLDQVSAESDVKAHLSEVGPVPQPEVVPFSPPEAATPSPPVNLIKNPYGAEAFNHWDVTTNGGSGWAVEQSGTYNSNSHVFVSSYNWCEMMQDVSISAPKPLRAHVTTMIARRRDCGAVGALSAVVFMRGFIIDEKETEETYCSDEDIGGLTCVWTMLSLDIDVPEGANTIRVKVKGKDTRNWSGSFGCRFGEISLTLT